MWREVFCRIKGGRDDENRKTNEKSKSAVKDQQNTEIQKPYPLGFSVGLMIITGDVDKVQDIITVADECMYRNKIKRKTEKEENEWHSNKKRHVVKTTCLFLFECWFEM